MKRIDFYETYYKNLSPSTFEVKKTDEKIEITGFDKKYPKNFTVKDVKQFPVKQQSMQSYEKGGQTNFNPDGVMKDKVVHSSGNAGGMLVGKRHSEGGIKAINKSTNQPIEMEGGEVVITRNAVSDNKKRSFNGKMMTNRQILSEINQSGGGVSFADGGEIPDNVKFDCNAQYEYGGKTMCGKDLAKKMAKGGAVDDDMSELTSAVQQMNEMMEKGGVIDYRKGTDLPVFYYDIDSGTSIGLIEFSGYNDGSGLPRYKEFDGYSSKELDVKNGTFSGVKYTSIASLPYVNFRSLIKDPRSPSLTGKNLKASDELDELYNKSIQKFIEVGEEFKVGKRKVVFERLTRDDAFIKDVRKEDMSFFPNSEMINTLLNPFGEILAYVTIEAENFKDADDNEITVKEKHFSLDELVSEISRLHQTATKTNRRRYIYLTLFGFDGKINDTQVVSLRVLPRKPQGSDYKQRRGFSANILAKNVTQFLYPLFYHMTESVRQEVVRGDSLIPTINIIPFLTGKSDLAKKMKADLEKAEKLRKEKEKKEKAEQKLKASYLADLEKTDFFNEINNTTVFAQDLQNKEDLTKLLASFQGVKYANQRARIIRELGKIKSFIYETSSELKSNSVEDKLFKSEGLLDYYFTQTTQSPVQDLGKPSNMPTPNGKESDLPYGVYLNVRSIPFKNWFGDWESAYGSNNYSDCSIMINKETEEPKLFFHGVRRFQKGMKGSAMGSGITRPFGSFTPSKFPASYFSDKKSYAEFYSGQSKNLPKDIRSKGFIYPVFLNIRRPLDLRPLGFESSYEDFVNYIKIVSGIKIKQSSNVVKMLQNDLSNIKPVWSFIRNDIQIIETLKDYGYDGIIQIGDIPRYDKNGNVFKDRSRWTKEDEFLTFYPNQVKSAVVKKSYFLPMFEDIRFKQGGYVSI